MPIQKQELKLAQSNQADFGKLTVNHPFVLGQLLLTFNDSRKELDNKKIENIIPYVLWNDMWNKIGIFGNYKEKPIRNEAKHRYARGRKVFVDLGYNVGTEASMPHPAIVLYNIGNMLIVAPTTSDDNKTFSKDIEDIIVRCPGDGRIFPKNTIITLHQLRAVAKNRVIKDLGCSVVDYQVSDTIIDHFNNRFQKPVPVLSYGDHLLKVLETKIAFHFAPDIFHQLVQLKIQNNSLVETQTELAQMNETLKEENKLLTEEVEDLKAQLSAIKLSFLEAAATKKGE